MTRSKTEPSLQLLTWRSGYLQIDVEKGDRKKTKFISHNIIYQFGRMPSRLGSEPETLHRAMAVTPLSDKWIQSYIYLDYVVISFEDPCYAYVPCQRCIDSFMRSWRSFKTQNMLLLLRVPSNVRNMLFDQDTCKEHLVCLILYMTWSHIPQWRNANPLLDCATRFLDLPET